jgi:hypothetical protein
VPAAQPPDSPPACSLRAQAGVRLAIVRPSIIESCLREPLPGWIEGMRVLDPVAKAVGKGHLPGFATAL